MNKKAICILSKCANNIIFSFAEKLKNDKYDIFICIDDNDCKIPEYNVEKITVIQIYNNESEKDGFTGSVVYTLDRACSRDKALYYFCIKNTKYDYIWFLEDDVFIPTIHTISNLDDKYLEGDLLSSFNEIKLSENDNRHHWQHWFRNKNKIIFPWAHSMISAIRVSKVLLQFILKFVKVNKFLLFDELLFNTIALQNNLHIINPIELSNIIFSFRDLELKEINPLYLYHPIKNCSTHEKLRKTNVS
jgi:hypothetical protein